MPEQEDDYSKQIENSGKNIDLDKLFLVDGGTLYKTTRRILQYMVVILIQKNHT